MFSNNQDEIHRSEKFKITIYQKLNSNKRYSHIYKITHIRSTKNGYYKRINNEITKIDFKKGITDGAIKQDEIELHICEPTLKLINKQTKTFSIKHNSFKKTELNSSNEFNGMYVLLNNVIINQQALSSAMYNNQKIR